MMSIDARRSLALAASVRYAKATKKEKGAILDEFCANTALSRKHSLRLLLQPPEPRTARRRRKRAKVYGEPEQLAMRRLWPLLNYPSARRTVAGLADLIEPCERHGEWVPDGALRERLLAMSASTCDRLLQPLRRVRPKGHSLTRPGKYLRAQIAVRIETDWDDAVPGFSERDLVAHCGGSAEGSFHFTLTLTDVCLGWTEVVALSSKGQIQDAGGHGTRLAPGL